jgi:hypothetical protein
MGLSETGEIKPYQYDKLTSQSIILAKELENRPCPAGADMPSLAPARYRRAAIR